jgi:hypothetical protein
MADTQERSAYEFVGGYPTPETAQRAFDEADFNRGVRAYRFLPQCVDHGDLEGQSRRAG